VADLKIYGNTQSRAFRVLWVALELGIDFDLIPLGTYTGETKTPEFLKINPNGTIPAIQDGDVNLWESLAITYYLAKKHGGPLAPKDAAEDAKTFQWTLFGVDTFEKHGSALIVNAMKPENERDPAMVEQVRKAYRKPLDVLEGHLSENDYVLGERFTVADINLAATLTPAARTGFDLTTHPKVDAWVKACIGRPAAKAAREMKDPE
jgi:glutathione S-transferase